MCQTSCQGVTGTVTPAAGGDMDAMEAKVPLFPGNGRRQNSGSLSARYRRRHEPSRYPTHSAARPPTTCAATLSPASPKECVRASRNVSRPNVENVV